MAIDRDPEPEITHQMALKMENKEPEKIKMDRIERHAKKAHRTIVSNQSLDHSSRERAKPRKEERKMLTLIVLLASLARTQADWRDTSADPTICYDQSCRCDAFSRIICNCTNEYDEVTIRPEGSYRMLSSASAIIIRGCARVYFFPYSINGTIQMRSIELLNNRQVEFKENSMLWSPYSKEHELTNPGLRILIDNCTINNIDSYALKGRVDEIVIKNSRIISLRPYAFSSLSGINSIVLNNNDFFNIDIHAFKKFSMESFVIKGGNARYFPSRFLSDVEILDNFRIDQVKVQEIASNAYIARGMKRITIENNNIGVLQGDAFRIATRGPVTFRNNTVKEVKEGAFLGFSVERPVISSFGLQDLLIDNNTMYVANLESFYYNRSSFHLRIDGLNLAQACECKSAEKWMELISSQGGTVSCNNTLERHFVSLPTYLDSRCGQFKEVFWLVFGSVLIVVALLGAFLILCVVRNENQKKKMQVVMPDGKTYKETELHIILERAELLTTDL